MAHLFNNNTNNTTSKKLLTSVVCSVLLLTACSSQKEVKKTAATAVTDQVVSTMVSAMAMGNKMAKAAGKEEPISQDKISCVIGHDKQKAVDSIQALFLEEFSGEEMKKLNDYFSSEAGKKQVEMTNKLLKSLMGGDEKFDFMAMQKSMTPEVQQKIQEFGASEVGKKLMTTLQNKAKIEPHMKSFVEALQTSCKLGDAKK